MRRVSSRVAFAHKICANADPNRLMNREWHGAGTMGSYERALLAGGFVPNQFEHPGQVSLKSPRKEKIGHGQSLSGSFVGRPRFYTCLIEGRL